MSGRCAQGHRHRDEGEIARCDARHFDATGLMKMAEVNFASPRKIGHVYGAGVPGSRSGVPVLVFAEEEIVPWEKPSGKPRY